MNEDQILWLSGQCCQGFAYWRDGDNQMLKIKRVSVEPVDVEKDGTAVPAAFLEVQGYLDLYNADAADFFSGQPMFGNQ
jgi:hypothetical protein